MPRAGSSAWMVRHLALRTALARRRQGASRDCLALVSSALRCCCHRICSRTHLAASKTRSESRLNGLLALGNDDSGVMGANVIFPALGMFSVAGSSVYPLSTPMLPSYEMTGNVARLNTEGFDRPNANKVRRECGVQGGECNELIHARPFPVHSTFGAPSSMASHTPATGLPTTTFSLAAASFISS